MTRSAAERLAAKSAPLSGTDCIVWTGHVRESGYATIQHEGRKQLVHRVAHLLYIGPIPDGYQVDHLCFTRHCVNPAHLEAVTPMVNTMRSSSPSRFNAEKTHCDAGHAFTPENTRVDPKRGSRLCRRCDADRQATYRARDPEKTRAAQQRFWDENREELNARRRASYRARRAAEQTT